MFKTEKSEFGGFLSPGERAAQEHTALIEKEVHRRRKVGNNSYPNVQEDTFLRNEIKREMDQASAQKTKALTAQRAAAAIAASPAKPNPPGYVAPRITPTNVYRVTDPTRLAEMAIAETIRQQNRKDWAMREEIIAARYGVFRAFMDTRIVLDYRETSSIHELWDSYSELAFKYRDVTNGSTDSMQEFSSWLSDEGIGLKSNGKQRLRSGITPKCSRTTPPPAVLMLQNFLMRINHQTFNYKAGDVITEPNDIGHVWSNHGIRNIAFEAFYVLPDRQK